MARALIFLPAAVVSAGPGPLRALISHAKARSYCCAGSECSFGSDSSGAESLPQGKALTE